MHLILKGGVMAKKDKGDFSPAEDYLAQLEWRYRHGNRHHSVFYEPKWRYKIVFKNNSRPSTLPLIFFISLIILMMGYILYQILVNHSGQAVFAFIFFGLVVTII